MMRKNDRPQTIKEATKGFLIGDIARRTGVSVSALRFYERKGLISSQRNTAGRRIFTAADIRRVSFILIAQQLGFSLAHIKAELDQLPAKRPPNKADWARISQSFGLAIDDRIDRLTLLRERLNGCIGCGCLSLDVCQLYNPDDAASVLGSGPRFLLGDAPFSEGA